MAALNNLGAQWPEHYNVNILYNKYSSGPKPHAAYLGTSFHANVNDDEAAQLESWGKDKINKWRDENEAD